jgi:hypothetical protein
MLIKSLTNSALLFGALAISGAAIANCPAGWTNVTSGKAVRLCQKGSLYVQRVDLSGGARVRLAYQFENGPGSIGYANPSFIGRDATEWWSFATANNGNNVPVKPAGKIYSVVSGSFFDGEYAGVPSQRSAFPIKNRGGLLTIGGQSGQGQPLREFRMNDSDASIVYLANNPLEWNQTYSAIGPFTSVVGLHPGNVDPFPQNLIKIGRSYIGLRDNNGDGKFEWAMFLSTNSATKSEVYAALTTDFGTQVNIQMDGSGTAQLVSRGTEYVRSSDSSRRNFPMAFVIYEAP